MMLLSICFNIFIICYIGEILTEQVSKLYIINSSLVIRHIEMQWMKIMIIINRILNSA